MNKEIIKKLVGTVAEVGSVLTLGIICLVELHKNIKLKDELEYYKIINKIKNNTNNINMMMIKLKDKRIEELEKELEQSKESK